MKKLFCLLVLAFLAVFSVSFAADQDLVDKAHALKAKGDWKGAAEVAPQKLCAAIYYFNAAGKICGHRDDNGDWAINDENSASDLKEALALLDEADEAIVASKAQKGTEDAGCTGVDVKVLKAMITNMRACCEGHCN